MRITSTLYILFTLLSFYAIGQKLTSPEMDTIPTAQPLFAKGKWIDPDSVSPPKIVPANPPKRVKAYNNKFKVSPPQSSSH